MARKEVTAAVVRDAEQLLAQGIGAAEVAARLELSEYVVGPIAQNAGCGRTPMKPRKTQRRVLNVQPGIDAATIRSVQRMLAVGILRHGEIAREAGVSANLVADVAAGRRRAVTLSRPLLDDGERFLPSPIRCSGCGASISVLPCRTCRALAVAEFARPRDGIFSENA